MTNQIEHINTKEPFSIDQLVEDLKPVTPLNLRRLVMYITAISLSVSTALLLIIGLRPNFSLFMNDGIVIFKVLLLSFFGMAFLSGLYAYARPVMNKQAKHASFVFLGLGSAVLLSLFLIQLSSLDFMFLLERSLAARADALACFASIIICGSIIFSALWFSWLKNTASSNPARLGSIAAASCGAFAASGYSLHCGQDNAFYILFYYGGSILILGLLGHFAGKRVLHW